MSKEKPNKVKKPIYKRWWFWVLAVIIVGSIASGGEEETATTEPESNPVEELEKVNEAEEVVDDLNNQLEEATGEDVDKDGAVEKPKEEPKEEPKEPEMSVSQQGAVTKAESYIDMGGFSKKGLIKQLEFEGFPTEEANFAVENIEVDWKEQAKIKAQSYVDMGGFNRQSLLEQLQFEEFTTDEATYGVNEVGL